MMRGGGAKRRSPNFAICCIWAARTAVGVLFGEKSSVVVFSRRLLNHKKSNNPVPGLSRHTVPTNLTPQMNEDDCWDVVVPKSHTRAILVWCYKDRTCRPATSLLGLSDQWRVGVIQVLQDPSPLCAPRKLPKRSMPPTR
jgi:hypothetical protein